MKKELTISQIAEGFKNNFILPDEEFKVEARTITRMYSAVQNAQNKVAVLEAKLAVLELQLDACKPLRTAIYG